MASNRFRSKSMAANVMQALQYDRYGGGAAALKHAEIPIPTPKKDEVLIKLEARSLNPIDWKIQEGFLRPFVPRKFPFVPAGDVAGEIVGVAPGVEAHKIGDKVVSILGPTTGGGLAEYAVAQAKLTVIRPPEVSAAEAAGLPVACLIALQALTDAAEIKLDAVGKAKNILITAASGGVGHYAIQLAKLGNTHVTATCGARNIEFVKNLGADEVLDYRTAEGSTLKSPSGCKYDAVIHCTTGIPWSTFEPNLSENGKVIDITPGTNTLLTYAMQRLTFSKKKLVPRLWNAKRENLEFVVKLLKEGKLRTVVDSRFPLSKAVDGWAKIMEGHATGKVIIEP
ncbi:hypothetical protein AAC387_Pa02g1725 [Persea americana]